MWDLEKAIMITNNDRVYEKYKNDLTVILLNTYEEVLIKTRDLVYDRHKLLTHPQASSLKPNQTPYRSVVVYPKGKEDNTEDNVSRHTGNGRRLHLHRRGTVNESQKISRRLIYRSLIILFQEYLKVQTRLWECVARNNP